MDPCYFSHTCFSLATHTSTLNLSLLVGASRLTFDPWIRPINLVIRHSSSSQHHHATLTRSEYWKSVPKYWCKFCKTYVRDTPLEKKQHDSTARHQGSIQKSLRDLHKLKEREDRETQRAKDEVARLNGLTNTGVGSSVAKAAPVVTREVRKMATADDRKRQMAQLAAMGVAIPEEFRGDVAMAGDWTTVARRGGEMEEKGTNALTSAEKKRKMKDRGEQEDEEEQEEGPANRRGWGRALKKFPTDRKGGKDDLDDLLGGPIMLKKAESDLQDHDHVKEEDVVKAQDGVKDESEAKGDWKRDVKDEPTEDISLPELSAAESKPPQQLEPSAPPVVFKKRKVKPIK
jgi:hypothetical protein